MRWPQKFALAITITLVSATADAKNCAVTSVGRTPLDSLGTGLYLGQFQGGLYPGGSNTMPSAHSSLGTSNALAVTRRNGAGQPSASGKYVLLSIGMSNATQEFCSTPSTPPCDAWTFMPKAAAHPDVVHDALVIVNGARGGQTATTWDSPTDSNYDLVRDTRLATAGVTEAQVQVVWLKQANPNPTIALPAANADARALEASLGNIVRALRVRYVNLKLVFVSSRTYGGYSEETLNPEPYAYEGAFAFKWLIEAQIGQETSGAIDPVAGNLGASVAPWLAWGPYLWANGTTPRSDGLVWLCEDVIDDGVHPSASGQAKVADRLLAFFLTSPHSLAWFRSTPFPGAPVFPYDASTPR